MKILSHKKVGHTEYYTSVDAGNRTILLENRPKYLKFPKLHFVFSVAGSAFIFEVLAESNGEIQEIVFSNINVTKVCLGRKIKEEISKLLEQESAEVAFRSAIDHFWQSTFDGITFIFSRDLGEAFYSAIRKGTVALLPIKTLDSNLVRSIKEFTCPEKNSVPS